MLGEFSDAVLDNLPGLFCLLTEQGKVVRWNKNFERALHCTAAEVTALAPLEFFGAVQRDAVKAALQSALAEGSASFEAEFGTRDAFTPHLFAAERTVIADRVYIVATGVRLVAHKPEPALAESEQKFRQLAEHIDAVFWLSDLAKGEMAYVSPAYETVWGRTQESLYKTPESFTEAVHPEDRARVVAAFAAQARGEYDEVYRVLRPDGTVRWVRDRAFPIVDAHGAPYRIVGVAEDVTERKRAEAALAESEARYRDLFENAGDLIYTHDLDGNFLSFNRVAERVTGYSADDASHLNIAQVVAPEQLAYVREMMAGKLVAGGSTTYELTMLTREQRRVAVEVSTRLITEQGQPVAVQGIARDVSERRVMERALREQRELYETILTSVPVEIAVLDPQQRYLFCNPAMIQSGALRAWLIGKDDFEYCAQRGIDSGVARTRREHFDRAAAQRRTVSWEERTTAQSDVRYHWRNLEPLFSADGELKMMLSYGRDITERKRANDDLEQRVAARTTELAEANRQLQHDAFHDALTGLPNRALFMDRLGQALGRDKGRSNDPFAVFFFDLDRFKVVNDSLGHPAGDALLVAIAERLQTCVRPTDTVARFGGDEFTLLCLDVRGPAELLEIATRLKAVFAQPFSLAGQEQYISASIGIVPSTVGYDRAEEVLRDADIAMYCAKAQGKGEHAVFDVTMRERTLALIALEADLRLALERDEFVVYYQPIVDAGAETLTGFEALVRWQHPQRGVVSPADFIPVAEDTGLVSEIDRFVLRAASRQIVTWQTQAGVSLKLSVNLSGAAFADADLAAYVAEVLRETGLAAAQLKLEITESILLDRSEAVGAALAELRQLGTQLYIDDFGTGYSSLSYLQRFSASGLKIDRSFVYDMTRCEKSAELVRTIVTMAHNLGMQVVAEGVETTAQLEQLRAWGCEYVQGYLFAPPLEAAAALTYKNCAVAAE